MLSDLPPLSVSPALPNLNPSRGPARPASEAQESSAPSRCTLRPPWRPQRPPAWAPGLGASGASWGGIRARGPSASKWNRARIGLPPLPRRRRPAPARGWPSVPAFGPGPGRIPEGPRLGRPRRRPRRVDPEHRRAGGVARTRVSRAGEGVSVVGEVGAEERPHTHSGTGGDHRHPPSAVTVTRCKRERE